MRYTLYYDDYHNHQHDYTFNADSDKEAIEKAERYICGLGYGDEELWVQESDGTRREVDW